MVNLESPTVQYAVQNGANFSGYNYPPQQMYMGMGYNGFMNPPMPPQQMYPVPGNFYNNPYYMTQQNKPYDMLHYNQPGAMPYYSGYPQGYPQNGFNGYESGAYPQYGNGNKFNPLIGAQQQPQMQQTYTIDGYNPLGTDKIYTADMLERLRALDEKYSELNDEKMEERQSLYYDNPYNYYGYLNTSYVDPILLAQYNREVQQIHEEAIQARIDLNERLSRAVHYYRGDIDVDNEEQWREVQQAYQSRTIEIPEATINCYQEANILRSTKDITEQLREGMRQANAMVSKEHDRLVDPKSDLIGFFDHAGLILWQNAFDEAQHMEKLARRNKYSRRDFIKYLKGEGKRYDRNISIPEGFETRENRYNPNDAFYSLFPNLRREDGWSYEDGVLKLNYPDRLKAGDIEVNNEQSNYERQRLEFANAVYNKIDPRDPRSGGGIY